MSNTLETYYGLPADVCFCSKCVMSNQRPASAVEFKHTIDSKKTTLSFDEEGVCDACRFAEEKQKIDWKDREAQLVARLINGNFVCVCIVYVSLGLLMAASLFVA